MADSILIAFGRGVYEVRNVQLEHLKRTYVPDSITLEDFQRPAVDLVDDLKGAFGLGTTRRNGSLPG